MKYSIHITLAAALLLSGTLLADTTISYQGRLDSGGQPYTGTPNLDFRLYDSATGGSLLGDISQPGVPVTEGLFQVELDFGDVFGDGPRWLEVRVNGAALEPRQAIRPAPLATFAMDIADDAVTSAKLNNMGAAPDDVLKWNGLAWVPAPENNEGSPTGAAGGDLTGSYPNPGIAPNAVTSTKIASGAVTFAKLAADARPGLQQGTGPSPGYRRADADPNNYGTLGNGAIDLSWSNTSSTTYGAAGSISTAMGGLTTASGTFSTAIGNGTVASGTYSTSMGFNTTASGTASTAMGDGTTASGQSSTAMGTNTTASGQLSTAMGSFANATHLRSFVINGSGSELESSADRQMTMSFQGGYRLFTNSGSTIGVSLPGNGNSWSTISDSTKKENFLPTDGQAFLQKIRTMNLGSWNYIGQDPETHRHYGPMAQEFHARFGNDGMGTIGNDTTIATADIDGVMMIAIQALIEENEALKAENRDMRAEFDARLGMIEAAFSVAPSSPLAADLSATRRRAGEQP